MFITPITVADVDSNCHFDRYVIVSYMVAQKLARFNFAKY